MCALCCANGLSKYEKTIYCLAIAHSISGVFNIKADDIESIADLLHVDCQLFRKALTLYNDESGVYNKIIKEDSVFTKEYFKNSELIDAVIKLHLSQSQILCKRRIV